MHQEDAAFLRAFESGALPNSAFHHRDHLRLAWIYLRRDGPELGPARVIDGIRQFAAAQGAADRFHETLTRFWISLVHHVDEVSGLDRFDDLVCRYPFITDKSLVYRHYSAEALRKPVARNGWIEPDLLPLPR